MPATRNGAPVTRETKRPGHRPAGNYAASPSPRGRLALVDSPDGCLEFRGPCRHHPPAGRAAYRVTMTAAHEHEADGRKVAAMAGEVYRQERAAEVVGWLVERHGAPTLEHYRQVYAALEGSVA